jgi:hypothetical protein
MSILFLAIVAGVIIEIIYPEVELKHALTALQRERAENQTIIQNSIMRNYTFAQKSEFVDNMKKELFEIQKELDLFSATVDNSEASAKIERKSSLDATFVKLAGTRQQLNNAEKANESNWYNVNNRFRSLFVELKDSVEKTRLQMNEKYPS